MNLGVAAHVWAASAGGPRFDPSLTPEQRASSANGVWLCQTCSKLIDSDIARFTIEVLNDWKSTAEHLAASENQRYLADNHNGASIFVAADDWQTWIDSGTTTEPGIIVVSYFSAGDVVYSCNLRFQNRSKASHLLTKPRVELVAGGAILESVDANVIELSDIELPTDKWVGLNIHNGFDGSQKFNRAESVWFRCNVVGQDDELSVKIATLSATRDVSNGDLTI